MDSAASCKLKSHIDFILVLRTIQPPDTFSRAGRASNKEVEMISKFVKIQVKSPMFTIDHASQKAPAKMQEGKSSTTRI